MPALYTIPHPYNNNMHQQHRQRRSHRIETTTTAATTSTRRQEPGSSLSYPIVIPPSPSPCGDANVNYSTSSWNVPDGEPFAWPFQWFDVPSITPPRSQGVEVEQLVPLEGSIDMCDTLPDLIHSDAKTPEASPVSSFRDACTTPAQEVTSSAVAICDVPLVAPRPLPFTPPAFLQFDCLPDEDEDLSFPPYTRSRRHLCDSDAKKHHQNQNPIQNYHKQIQNPRKRPAPPPNTPANATTTTTTRSTITPGTADAEMDSAFDPASIVSKKRRRLTVNLTTHGENAAPPVPTTTAGVAAISRMHYPPVVPAQQQPAPAVFMNNLTNGGQFCFHPQLAHYTRDGMMHLGMHMGMGMGVGVGMGWV